jgi:hypothetical protein
VLYDPDWLSLLDARERLKARGAEATEAESAICLALRDRKLRPRWTLGKVTYGPTGATLSPTYIRALEFKEGNKLRLSVPADLKPADIDWDNSRPLRPLPFGPWQHQLLAHVSRVEVLRTDLEKAFPILRAANAAEEGRGAAEPPANAKAEAEAQGETSPPNGPGGEEIARPENDSAPMDLSDEPRREDEPTGHKRRKKRGTKLERAKRAIAELESLRGSLAELTDSELFSAVCSHLGIRETEISLETVRRAAGRRK